MAWFRCMVGGGASLSLTVTCSPDFAGLTITCTDGTSTLTATCPSASPYEVTFKLPNAGTWTISGVISGVTQQTTVEIPDTANLYNTPTGSTATPTDDIQIWLHCANIWDKNYSTINEVLADTTTLLALISSNNAVDYMARSTSWASTVCANQTAMGYIGNNDYCANKLLANSTWLTAICNSTYFESVLNVKIPTMTSNTTPSGEASASTEYSNNKAYHAFDGVQTEQWSSYPNDSNPYVEYDFEQPVNIKLVKINNTHYQLSGNITEWNADLQAYDEDSWVTIKSGLRATRADGWTAEYIIDNNTIKSSKYKFLMTSVLYVYDGNNYYGANKIYMYGRA